MSQRSAYDPPRPGQRVLVWLERYPNPPALNAPGKFSFGHHIPNPGGNPHWPTGGWFFDGSQEDYRVAAWWPLPEYREQER